MHLRLVGYWRNDQHPEYPDPHDFVDEGWNEEERRLVGDYLSNGTHLRAYMGRSPCRLCGMPNGASELTDGVLAWPEGLPHYVLDHAVRLPQAIISHVLEAVDALDDAEVSDSWWVTGATTEIEGG
jgi:hypothetical protein